MSLKKDLRKFLLGAVAIVPFFGLASTQAQAEVLADALLVIDNFIFHDGTGSAYSFTEIDIQTAANFANTGGGGLDSVGLGGGDLGQNGSNTINPPGDNNGDVNLTAIFEGTLPAGHGDDSYTPFPNPPTTHYAYADADVNGVGIDTPAGPAGVTAQTQASAGLISPDSGDANANTGLNATFDFIAGVDGELHVSFDFDALARTFVDPDDILANALATTSWFLRIRDVTAGTLALLYIPTELQLLAGSDQVNDGTDETISSGSLSFFIIDLIAGNRYSIQIQHEVSADAFLQVPEPGTVLLVGGGLIFLAGFGYVQGRRRLIFQA
jgi:hypothetical protein